ncbi:MAG: hypothetical protein ACRDHZ_18050 [Ktedonobacteraceae bacterium]
MFQSKKKNVVEEQVFEDVTDEQLSQVTGGSGVVTSLVGSLLSTGTGAVSGMLDSVNVTVNPMNGSSVSVAGIGVTLPGISTLGLI